MKRAGALASALRSSGATVSGPSAADSPTMPEAEAERAPTAKPAARRTTKAITVHFPEEVRRQLKALAAEQGRNVEDVMAEALNLVFAKYLRPEIAPRKKMN
jgi:hypothetical protein